MWCHIPVYSMVLTLHVTSHNNKICQFYKFWPFSKTSLKLSASTPPSYLVVIVLLGIYPRYVSYTAGVSFPNKVPNVTFPNKVRFGHCM